RPFHRIAEILGRTEEEVLASLRRLWQAGKISRIGAVFATQRLGVSTLAALAVPSAQLETVATWINEYPEVNHNYQREHAFNLWFVLTAESAARVQTILAEIRERTGLPLLDLPLLEPFHIDLGFDLQQRGRRDASAITTERVVPAPIILSDADRNLLAALQPGLSLINQPYHALGQALDLSEQAVLERLHGWLQQGLIKRLGIIVHHRALGYHANAMVVWDIPDTEVGMVGRNLAMESGVNLCYRRPRRLPHWRYNLFCMIHGRERDEVLAQIERLRIARNLESYPYSVLFSVRCFRQRGAYYHLTAPVLPVNGKAANQRRITRYETAAWTS
ncbi:MAG: Lrp/AsnC family transcriptional regulator, partial [Phycisphaerales bacterium]|nr:Lrp/AsnC family transcriptional regulator [Phycisphaerales bacterium]